MFTLFLKYQFYLVLLLSNRFKSESHDNSSSANDAQVCKWRLSQSSFLHSIFIIAAILMSLVYFSHVQIVIFHNFLVYTLLVIDYHDTIKEYLHSLNHDSISSIYLFLSHHVLTNTVLHSVNFYKILITWIQMVCGLLRLSSFTYQLCLRYMSLVLQSSLNFIGEYNPL